MTAQLVAETLTANQRPVDFQMSSYTHAVDAVDLLVAVGHSGALHIPPRTEQPANIVRVPVAAPEVSIEVSRLVHAVDPDAQPPVAT